MARAWEPATRAVLSRYTRAAVAQLPPGSSTGAAAKRSVRTPPPGLDSAPIIRYVSGSTTKLEQLIGDEDKERRQQTISLTITRYELQGTDLGYSFEHQGRVHFLFGDTVGRLGRALDTIATTDARNPEQGFRLDFLTAGDHYLTIEPPGISMGAFEVPVSGISIGGEMYVAVTTNHSMDYLGDGRIPQERCLSINRSGCSL